MNFYIKFSFIMLCRVVMALNAFTVMVQTSSAFMMDISQSHHRQRYSQHNNLTNKPMFLSTSLSYSNSSQIIHHWRQKQQNLQHKLFQSSTFIEHNVLTKFILSFILFLLPPLLGTNHASHASALTTSSTLENGIGSNQYDFNKGTNQRGGIDIDLLRQSLVTPTPDKPQITLSDNYISTIVDHDNTSNNISATVPSSIRTTKSSSSSSSSSKNKRPIAEGMIYLQVNNNNYNERPNLNDNIILTVSSASDPTNILAGAKYPVYRAKFPFNFKMYHENILKGKEQTWQQLERGEDISENKQYDSNDINARNSIYSSSNGSDLLITARICPEEIISIPCKDEESTYFAKGVSKILLIGNLPGATEGQSLRAPVSLPLIKKK